MAPRSTDSCSLTAMDCTSAVVSARSEEEDEEEEEEEEEEAGSIVSSLSKHATRRNRGEKSACVKVGSRRQLLGVIALFSGA